MAIDTAKKRFSAMSMGAFPNIPISQPSGSWDRWTGMWIYNGITPTISAGVFVRAPVTLTFEALSTKVLTYQALSTKTLTYQALTTKILTFDA